MDETRSHLLAFLLRLVVSAGVLWLSVYWVSPGNPHNTFWRAVLVSLVLSIAYYLTMARFLWFLIVPWILYVLVWLGVIMASYSLSFLRALLLALSLTVLSWLSSIVLGVRTLRS
ncbi:MAG TPA: hypothetical protein VFG59_19330 [Anaeromyxobacter sp.]|nr:hypothetical protein [Anaeromyxobacter sp.]